ncbi:hypothetical protein N7451_009534 [Penicillium sp. IBT 35674x]|nr:hypothetical protein N7451_009534 [Penicillium sp. IBT 35674x]
MRIKFLERSPSICTLFICLPLPVGEECDAMLDCKDGKSGNSEENEKHDDDDRDGNVALHILSRKDLKGQERIGGVFLRDDQ